MTDVIMIQFLLVAQIFCLLLIYWSLPTTGRITGIARQSIGKCANKNTLFNRAGGYKWEWYSEGGELKIRPGK